MDTSALGFKIGFSPMICDMYQILCAVPYMYSFRQQDAQEFLRYLLEGLHEDVNRVTTKPKHIEIKDDDFSR